MKKFAVLIAVLAIAAVTAARVSSQRTTPSGLTIEQLIDIRHPSNPMWSPDGRVVVFVWDRAGVSNVFVAAADGKSPPRELSAAGGSLNGAFWSVDGRSLMIAKGGDLWRVPIDGSAASAVWTTPQNESNITPSPDGARIAFVRSTSPVVAPQPAAGRGGRGGAGGGATELWVRSLTDGKETRVLAQAGIGGIGWSPDGQHLVFTSGASAIRHEQTPAYSGAKIIYTINENVPGRTYVVAASGGTPTELPGAGGGFGARRWLDSAAFPG